MKHKLPATLGTIIFMMSPLIMSTLHAQTVADGSYSANPSWDQTFVCTTLDNCPRFTVLSNMNSAAVLDRETGLVWEKSPSTDTFAWASEGATTHCNNLSLGNRKGWRLPTIEEMATLVDADPANTRFPRLPPGNPFQNVQGTSLYWAANPLNADGVFAWTVFLFDGSVSVDLSIDPHPAWCVRGGPGLDVQ
jgi:Protein of unknown function (DUF1566)